MTAIPLSQVTRYVQDLEDTWAFSRVLKNSGGEA
jgi:hypothetical protein